VRKDICPVADSVVDSREALAEEGRAILPKELQNHDARLWRDALYTKGLVGRRYDPSDVRAMRIRPDRYRSAVVHPVPTMNVVDESCNII
jgi:hypothetical protein